jgi:hypothetical protein
MFFSKKKEKKKKKINPQIFSKYITFVFETNRKLCPFDFSMYQISMR